MEDELIFLSSQLALLSTDTSADRCIVVEKAAGRRLLQPPAALEAPLGASSEAPLETPLESPPHSCARGTETPRRRLKRRSKLRFKRRFKSARIGQVAVCSAA